MAAESGENLYRVASFEGIAGTAASFKLGQIKPNADFDTWNNDYIATVNAYGSQDTYYTYSQDDGNWYEADDSGMISGDVANDVELSLNQGFIVYSANGAEFTYSGSVLAGDTALYTVAGDNTYTGNFTPATITLGDLVVDDAFDTWNNDYLATINAFGSQDVYYTYSQDDGNWYEADDSGMISGDIANDVEFEPNSTFLVYTANGAEINIPSPLPASAE
jgi:hypothetical protein